MGHVFLFPLCISRNFLLEVQYCDSYTINVWILMSVFSEWWDLSWPVLNLFVSELDPFKACLWAPPHGLYWMPRVFSRTSPCLVGIPASPDSTPTSQFCAASSSTLSPAGYTLPRSTEAYPAHKVSVSRGARGTPGEVRGALCLPGSSASLPQVHYLSFLELWPHSSTETRCSAWFTLPGARAGRRQKAGMTLQFI